MGKGFLRLLPSNNSSFLDSANQWDTPVYPGGLFASVGQVGVPRDSDNGAKPKLPYMGLYEKYVTSAEVLDENGVKRSEKRKGGVFKLKLKIANHSVRRLISGAVAGALSRIRWRLLGHI